MISCYSTCSWYISSDPIPSPDAVKAVNPFVKRIPQEKQEAFLMECLSELASLKTRRPDGQMVARYGLMVAHLQRSE